MTPVRRLAWAALALAAPLAAVIVLGIGVFALGFAIDQPDPRRTPERWSAVYAAVPFALLTGGGVGALLGLAVLGTGRAAGRRPPARHLVGTGAALAAVAVAATIGVVQASHAGEGWERADCDTFRLDLEVWRSGEPGPRLRSADAIARCGVLDGATADRAARLLGTPREDRRRPPRFLEWRIADDRAVLRLHLDQGRVRGGSLW